MFTWFISLMSHIHTLTFISLLDTHFCVLVALPVHSLPVLLCLPDLLSVGHAWCFISGCFKQHITFWLKAGPAHIYSFGVLNTYYCLPIEESYCLSSLAYPDSHFTKLIVLNCTRYSRRTNSFIFSKLFYCVVSFNTWVASLVKGINFSICFFVYRFTSH